MLETKRVQFFWLTMYTVDMWHWFNGHPLGELGLASLPLNCPSWYILFNTIPPRLSQTGGGEGTAVKEEVWRESTFHEGDVWFCIRITFLPPTSAIDIHWTSFFLQPPTDSWGRDVAFLYVCSQTSIKHTICRCYSRVSGWSLHAARCFQLHACNGSCSTTQREVTRHGCSTRR